MKTRVTKNRYLQERPTLNAAQVRATVAASGMSRLEFAEHVGCGTSQLFKYQKEGLPPRMNKEVKKQICEMAVQLGVVEKSVLQGRR